MSRVIVHLDMNAYFASVEQKADPRLAGRPVAVVGDLKRRSVVMTASYEARAYGVRTGSLYWEAKRLCPGLVAVVGDPGKYLAKTRELTAILETFSDQVEMTSIDEGYLDVTGSLKLFAVDGEGIARLIQAKVMAELGLPCSVGVAPNKILAKLASGMRKPMGVYAIAPEAVSSLLETLPVEELCGIGPRLKESLNLMGIRTCGELGRADLSALQGRFGIWGSWMRRWGRGEDDSSVRRVGESEPAKSMGHSTTLPKDTGDPKLIKSYILLLSEKVAARLRKGGYVGRTVGAVARYSDFTTRGRSRTVEEPLDDGPRIARHALGILREMKLEQPVRLLGVSVSGLMACDSVPYLLEDLEKGRLADLAMDEVNAKFGKGSLKRAGVLPAEEFGVLEPPLPPASAALRP